MVAAMAFSGLQDEEGKSFIKVVNIDEFGLHLCTPRSRLRDTPLLSDEVLSFAGDINSTYKAWNETMGVGSEAGWP